MHCVSTTEIPVNFKASENGEYTLTVSATPHSSLPTPHLIDNLTGNDIDLLTNPSYTFEAKTTDYASRFKLVFAPGNAFDDSDDFAYISNGQIIIPAVETHCVASLQVIDMTGRIVLCRDGACTVSTANMTPGVYVLRLINDENVKSQKIIME